MKIERNWVSDFMLVLDHRASAQHTCELYSKMKTLYFSSLSSSRDKSEKFLPLKKRKLHKADESASTPTTVATDSPVDGLSVSDSEGKVFE